MGDGVSPKLLFPFPQVKAYKINCKVGPIVLDIFVNEINNMHYTKGFQFGWDMGDLLSSLSKIRDHTCPSHSVLSFPYKIIQGF